MFQCLGSWVRHVNVPGNDLVRNPLLSAAFDALGNQELFETAVDLLVEVCICVYMYVGLIDGHDDVQP